MRRSWKVLLVTAGVTVLLLVLAALSFYERPLWFADQQMHLKLWRAGVHSDYVLVEGERIHYLEATAAPGSAGTPLVLIHGLGARSEDWAPLIPGLAAAGFHVYAPDLLGYGRSAHPDANYSISMQESMIAAFMRAMHIERADVAGWSMGGWVAMKLSLDYGSMVERLVVFDAAGVYFSGYSSLEEVFDARDAAGVNRLFAILTPHPRALPDFVARDIARRIQANVWVIKRSMAAMRSGRDLLDFRLYAIQQPTLVVWGLQDELIPISAGETMHKSIAGSSMVAENGCGHLAPSECSQATLRATVAFLQSDPPLRGVETVVDGRQ